MKRRLEPGDTRPLVLKCFGWREPEQTRPALRFFSRCTGPRRPKFRQATALAWRRPFFSTTTMQQQFFASPQSQSQLHPSAALDGVAQQRQQARLRCWTGLRSLYRVIAQHLSLISMRRESPSVTHWRGEPIEPSATRHSKCSHAQSPEHLTIACQGSRRKLLA